MSLSPNIYLANYNQTAFPDVTLCCLVKVSNRYSNVRPPPATKQLKIKQVPTNFGKFITNYTASYGHVMRMDDTRTHTKILQWKPIGTRTRGRPRKRCIVDIKEDMQIMGIRRWRNQCKETAEWKRITEKAKTHSGL
jgi:hypothetical protein